jgi:RNA polymerase sigma-70 factor (ECF subfamily)
MQSFEEFYERMRPLVLRYFAHRVKDPQQRVDLTSETFARMFAQRTLFRGSTDAEAEGWLWKIARTQLGMAYRRGTVETAALDRLRLRRPVATEDELLRVEELVDLDAAAGVLADAFDELSPAEQRLLEMRVVEERPYGDVVEEFDLPSEAAARQQVSRALRKLSSNQTLRRSLKGEDDD